ncbi:MAG: LUD domain-containing protein [Alphaproteobacteria bacterium]|nr:LUD domain-containing protein [Alphaproteobacteria bacterium]MBV9419216.1 LUD domain-containing protein [Alphaproteobacteria bacterium]MBV9541892.1 LUD domain-containing protein [Alphaproteobacteria bacterium]MBV9903688.1 LUD domain-containing protein [Alphaproteobacteria bacterium]
MSGGRDAILQSIRSRKLGAAPKPDVYSAPKTQGDLAESFAKKLSAQFADVRMLDSMADVPAAVADILRGKNMALRVHVAPDSTVGAMGSVEVLREPPGQFDAAVTEVPFAIAETGTLAYAAAKGRPASWHFRPVLEIAILRRADIVPELEDVLTRLGTLPSTLNLVSGPSRTGDIEQTMELGAHGPKSLAVLVIKE